MKLLFAFACIAVVSADVSHLQNKYIPPTALPEITQKYLPPVQPEITQKYLPPVQPEITQKYLPPVAKPEITQKFATPAAVPSFASYPSTYSSAALHQSSLNVGPTYVAPLSVRSLTNSYTAPTTFSHAVSPAISYSAISPAVAYSTPISTLSYAAPTYSLSHEATFHGKPELNPLPSYTNLYSGFDTVYNGQFNLGTEYNAKPEYTVHQPIVAERPIEPVVNYEPIENNDSTVISAAEYNDNNGYTYKNPEAF